MHGGEVENIAYMGEVLNSTYMGYKDIEWARGRGYWVDVR
jgi:hypothetical protein